MLGARWDRARLRRSRLSPWQCPQGGVWSPGRDIWGLLVTRLQGRALHVLLALSPELRDVRAPPGTWCVPAPALRLSRSRGNVTPSPAGIRAGYNGPGVTAPSRLRLLRAWPGSARGSSFKWQRQAGRAAVGAPRGSEAGRGVGSAGLEGTVGLCLSPNPRWGEQAVAIPMSPTQKKHHPHLQGEGAGCSSRAAVPRYPPTHRESSLPGCHPPSQAAPGPRNGSLGNCSSVGRSGAARVAPLEGSITTRLGGGSP